MQTQMVKNAVIVPAGAKGGFIVKRRAGTTPTPAQVIAAYRTFIWLCSTSPTTSYTGALIPPPGMLLYDDPDPYLVVAADKGTATFSDIAERARRAASVLARRCLRLRRHATATITRRKASPRAAPGSACAGTSAKWAVDADRDRSP